MIRVLFNFLIVIHVVVLKGIDSFSFNYRWRGRSLSLSHLCTSSSDSTPPSIAIVGSGAVGGYYGARLWEAGYLVKFQMRGDHYKKCKEDGLNVKSVYGDIIIPAGEIEVFEDTKDMGQVDWVIVALKSSSLDAIPDLIYPLLHQGTRVLNIMNGLIEEDVLKGLNRKDGKAEEDKSLTCCSAIYGGMALLCSNRVGPGHIDHSYAGLLTGGVAKAAEGVTAEQNREAFVALWEPTKVEIKYEEVLLRGRWVKNVWNLPFNGISVAMNGITIDVVVNDPGLRRLADIVMNETIAIANTDLANSGYDSSHFLGDAEKKTMMDLSDAMGPYKTSTMLDLTNRRPMEVQYLFRKPLERAERLGVSSPHLQTLVYQIEALQKMHGL